jgi:hypothetical protein
MLTVELTVGGTGNRRKSPEIDCRQSVTRGPARRRQTKCSEPRCVTQAVL